MSERLDQQPGPGGDDDEDWLAALAGRPRPGSDPATLREGALLRQAQRTQGQHASLDQAPEPQPVESLLRRARAEGLLEPHRGWCAGCAARLRALKDAVARRPRLGGAGLVLASLLAAWIVLPLLHTEPPEPPVLRAGPDGVVLVVDARPVARRDAMADALMAAGLPVQRYERLGRAGLDAELPPPPLPPAVKQALQSLGLVAPSDGVLRVEVMAPGP